MQRHTEIVICRGVRLVQPDRGFVVCDGFVDIAVLEGQVGDGRDRRRAGPVDREGLDQFGDGARHVAARDVEHGALIAHQRDLARRGRRTQRFAEQHGRLVEPAAFEGARSAVVGGLRRTSGEQTAQAVEERHAPMLHVDVVTLFPEMFAPVIGLSIVGRAVERGLVDVRTHHLLDALPPGERADARPYGGGPGMVLRIEPLARTLDAIVSGAPEGERRRIVLTSASGRVFRQCDALAWSGLDRLVLICGHYEGVDERLAALYPIEEISLGEFVLTGGELAAMAMLDAAVRLVDGAIDPDSAANDSWNAEGGLDHPAFTRPPTFRGVDVPDVLLSGDHGKIAEWRREQSRLRAAARNRPPLPE